jgi:hypothetical protein
MIGIRIRQLVLAAVLALGLSTVAGAAGVSGDWVKHGASGQAYYWQVGGC